MIHYHLSVLTPSSQELQVTIHFQVHAAQPLNLMLPAWRPGRYELQHYARNIHSVKASLNGTAIPVAKTTRNAWQLTPSREGFITVTYTYYCSQLDAGGSWIDDVLCYVNPINCLFWMDNRANEPCTLHLEMPHWATDPVNGLSSSSKEHEFGSYFELIDSPFFLSKQLTSTSYRVGETLFHIALHGEVTFDLNDLLETFKAFSAVQIKTMGVFPEKEYCFLLLLFPFRHYHGVEHHRSTVITLGPTQELTKPALFEELVSISSHELFHAWNICKIRPQEMYPYRLEEENYFRTGFVAEGFTTYLGEYFLRQSGFFSEERFLLEIEQWYHRHQLHSGAERASLADSSFDLWVDGYIAGSGDRKVSIYVAGALSAIALDLAIRQKSPGNTIFYILHKLYYDHALQHKGYTESDLKQLIVELLGEEEGQHYWFSCITGHQIEQYTQQLLQQFGLSLEREDRKPEIERRFGILLKPTTLEIAKIHQKASAFQHVMVGDIILQLGEEKINDPEHLNALLIGKTQCPAIVMRKGRILSVMLTASAESFWPYVRVKKNSAASDEQKLRYQQWLGNSLD